MRRLKKDEEIIDEEMIDLKKNTNFTNNRIND